MKISIRFTRAILISLTAAALFAAFTLADSLSLVRLPQSEQPVELYANQMRDDLRKTFISAIDRAQTSILLLMYGLTDHQLIRALRERAKAGIPVTVVVDAKASPHAKRQLGPQVNTVRRSPHGLMHLKILVVDGRQVWMGSANGTADSLRLHGNLVLALDHPALAQAIAQRAEGLPKIGAADPARPIVFGLSEQQGELWFLPSAESASERILQLIAMAQKSIRIAMFTWTRPDFTQAVIDAHQRGVDVQVAIDRRQGRGAGAETVHRLQKAGVPTYLSHGEGLLHHKLLWLDENQLVTGSANWTRSAFRNNDDCFVVLDPLTDHQRTFLHQLWQVLILESRQETE